MELIDIRNEKKLNRVEKRGIELFKSNENLREKVMLNQRVIFLENKLKVLSTPYGAFINLIDVIFKRRII